MSQTWLGLNLAWAIVFAIHVLKIAIYNFYGNLKFFDGDRGQNTWLYRSGAHKSSNDTANLTGGFRLIFRITLQEAINLDFHRKLMSCKFVSVFEKVKIQLLEWEISPKVFESFWSSKFKTRRLNDKSESLEFN